MKRFVLSLLVVVLFATGCTKDTQPVSPAKKEGLRKILDEAFVVTSIPKEREEDFYRILEAFAEGRRPDELVSSVVFKSEIEADISFSTSPNMHGGRGDATAKKSNGRWTVIEKVYVVKNEPNQALLPTTMSVTIPADAGLAPAIVAADL